MTLLEIHELAKKPMPHDGEGSLASASISARPNPSVAIARAAKPAALHGRGRRALAPPRSWHLSRVGRVLVGEEARLLDGQERAMSSLGEGA